MSDGVNPTFPEWMQTEWDDKIIHLYQDHGGRVANTVRKKVVTDAKDMIFRTIGKITVEKITGDGKRKRSGAKRQKITLTPEAVGTLLEVKEADLLRLTPDDRDHQQLEAYKAFSRDLDDVVVAAGVAGAKSTSIGGSGGTDFMSPVMIGYMWEELNAQGIYQGEEEVYCLISPRMHSHLMRFKEYASADYVGRDLPFKMKGKTYHDINFITFSRLPVSSNVRTGIFYTYESLCLGILQQQRTIWSWENTEDLWLGNMKAERDAARLIENGVFKFEVNEAITPESIDPEAYTAS
ncbi:MAG: phage capsid protein [Henriciella sp.]|uniref:phage capsid protein n=1 Tax=Henriciella sp. TaxID=1968823 RepID=UPI003C791DB4